MGLVSRPRSLNIQYTLNLAESFIQLTLRGFKHKRSSVKTARTFPKPFASVSFAPRRPHPMSINRSVNQQKNLENSVFLICLHCFRSTKISTGLTSPASFFDHSAAARSSRLSTSLALLSGLVITARISEPMNSKTFQTAGDVLHSGRTECPTRHITDSGGVALSE